MRPSLSVLLALILAHTAYGAEPIPSLATVYQGKFRFGFGGTNDRFVREALAQPDSAIRRIVEEQSNIINLNCFYLKHADVITAVMTWNVTDKTSWLRNHPTPHVTWPLLFDAKSQPKPAFWILAKPRG